MEVSRLLLIPTFKEIICSNLTFEDIIQLRDALKLNSLKCSIPFIDPKSNKKIIFSGVNSTTIATAELIKQHGLDLALVEAAKNGKNAVVQTLLTAKDIDVGAVDRYGWTALMVVAINGQNLVVQTLIAAKANVNMTTRNGWTALMMAAHSKRDEVVKTLLTAKDINVNAASPFGQTALILAAKNGHNEIVKSLLNVKDINVNATDHNGNTALMLATFNNRHEVVQILRATGAH